MFIERNGHQDVCGEQIHKECVLKTLPKIASTLFHCYYKFHIGMGNGIGFDILT